MKAIFSALVCQLLFLCGLTAEGYAVFRLSIIIPAPNAATESQALEETLVSVLENRPTHCEVIVACESGYQDPYDLEDEVSFVSTFAGDSWTAHANHALTQTRGRFIHILRPGATVTEDWHKDACDYLARCPDQVVGVTPTVEYATTGKKSVSATAGVHIARSGRRRFVNAPESGEALASDDHGLDRFGATFGPCDQASFFRRAQLVEAGGWNETIRPEVADVELALRLRSLGYDFVHRPESIVAGIARKQVVSFGTTRDLERVYRTYRAKQVMPRRGVFAAMGGVFSGSVFGRFAGRFGQLPMAGLEVASPGMVEVEASEISSRAA